MSSLKTLSTEPNRQKSPMGNIAKPTQTTNTEPVSRIDRHQGIRM